MKSNRGKSQREYISWNRKDWKKRENKMKSKNCKDRRKRESG